MIKEIKKKGRKPIDEIKKRLRVETAGFATKIRYSFEPDIDDVLAEEIRLYKEEQK